MSASTIEWTQFTWNPFAGCSKVSLGCENCYAIRAAARLESMGHVPHYVGLTVKSEGGRPNWSRRIAMASERIVGLPLRLPEGSLVFVNSMSDMFHETATDAMRDRVLEVIERRPDITFQILTKRPENIAPYLQRARRALPRNVWLGVSIENCSTLSRLAILTETSATVLFVSIEPMLDDVTSSCFDPGSVDWVIAGGESGPRARPMLGSWVRRLRDTCVRAGTPFFFKQWGTYANNPLSLDEVGAVRAARVVRDLDPHGKGGALLDGVLWRQMPGRTPTEES